MGIKPIGRFVLSLDVELGWGLADRKISARQKAAFAMERSIIRELLSLFSKYHISATWAIVGHLFLERCEADGDSTPHAEIVGGEKALQEWFSADPTSDSQQHPDWYGPDIVKLISECPVPQEIACHGFSHVEWSRIPADAARRELKACACLAEERGIRLRSFVFPRNRIAHLDVLSDAGFIAFRGVQPRPFGHHRIARLMVEAVEQLFAIDPPVVRPSWTASGVVEIPGSMFWPPRERIGAMCSVRKRVTRAIAGLNRAIERRAVFHLWFHPYNLAGELPLMLSGLEEVIAYADLMRRRGLLLIQPMESIAREVLSGDVGGSPP